MDRRNFISVMSLFTFGKPNRNMDIFEKPVKLESIKSESLKPLVFRIDENFVKKVMHEEFQKMEFKWQEESKSIFTEAADFIWMLE